MQKHKRKYVWAIESIETQLSFLEFCIYLFDYFI